MSSECYTSEFFNGTISESYMEPYSGVQSYMSEFQMKNAYVQNACEAPQQEFMMSSCESVMMPCESAAAQMYLVPATAGAGGPAPGPPTFPGAAWLVAIPAPFMTPMGPAMQWPCVSTQMPAADAFVTTAPCAPDQFSMEQQSATEDTPEPIEPSLLTCGGMPCVSAAAACKSALEEASLATMPNPEDLPSASLLTKSAELSDVVAQQMESCDHARLGVILRWLKQAGLELALSACGCRVVQKAFEVAGGAERAALVEPLRGHAVKLLESPHGNHVLQKCIETLPNNSVQFVVDELGAYRGGWAALARHRYGCRVEERLIEQLPEEMLGMLMTAVIADTHTLCSHPFGNYVVQHILEYGSKEKRAQVVAVLIQDDIVSLALHRVASNVVEKAVEFCGTEEIQTLARAILAVGDGLLTMGTSRYGSHTARRLLEVLPSTLRDEAMQQLRPSIGKLRSSKYGRAIAQRVQAGALAGHQPFQV